MRKFNGLGVVLFVVVICIIEYYSFSAIKFSVKNLKPLTKNLILGTYIALVIAWIATIFMFPAMRNDNFDKTWRNILIAFGMGFLITKIIIASILLLDDLRRLLYTISSLFFQKENLPNAVHEGMTRSEFMTKFALAFGGTLFGTMLYGMGNRYNYKLRNIKLSIETLPASFKGMRIVQISDLHSGSLTNKEAVKRGIDLILAQKPDIIFFTGDLVNNKSDEMDDYIDIFSQLKAPLGVYSILGNHDYGDYVEWQSTTAKNENLNRIKSIHQQMGWQLLLNENKMIEKSGERIAILGVENISSKRFHSYGDLSKAYEGSAGIPFKILLSHDPSHWDGETNKQYKDIDLTLSGHTHGMQFGVEIPWLKWSPVQYVYKQWAGLYQQDNQYLYINRGFGFIGYPGRVGIMPEVTLIELS
jgi:predicted MPP superfamily phosphohydrolase